MGADLIDLDSSVGAVLTQIRGEQGKVVVKRTQDTTAILEANAAQRAEAPSWNPYGSSRRDQSLKLVARIPNIVAEQWMREGVNVFSNDPEQKRKVAQKLNSNEYAYLRTYPGRVGYRA